MFNCIVARITFLLSREDILAFLTGQEEIEAMAQNLRIILHQDQDKPHPKGIVIPLYAAQQISAQQKVFNPTKDGMRKIILATNIAETSLTIPGIRHVVDSCRVKAK
jgi:HrpA-like RNA helicase